MTLQFHDLAALDAPILGQGGGTPMQLPLDSIDEDPEQPRCEFDAEGLQELAETIRTRGVMQPVSVRPHPELPDRWMLNFGARRLRASRIAGLTEIPAFVDASAGNYDQVIENEHREGLKPLELALFVKKRLEIGESQSEIARRMGKSRAYVTYATALIDPPDWLLDLYRQGRCRDLHALYELRRLHGVHQQRVVVWTDGRAAITRDDVAGLRAELAEKRANSDRSGASVITQTPGHKDTQSQTAATLTQSPSPGLAKPGTSVSQPQKPTGRCLVVEKDGQSYELLLFAVPVEPGHVYVRPLQGGDRQQAEAATLTLRGFQNR